MRLRKGVRYCSVSCMGIGKRIPTEVKFWESVERSEGCWVWAGARDRRPRHGYGITRVDGRNVGAHRVAWELTHGPIPSGQHVLHRCDNPPCVNPAHLFLGTHQDNMRDMMAKVRNARGERSGNAKLIVGDVRRIRWLVRQGHSQSAVARLFGLNSGTVNRISRGLSWKHVS